MNMRAAVYSDTYHYRGYWQCESKCLLTIWTPSGEKPLTIMLSELPENPGTSVTNFYESIATEVLPSAMQFMDKPVDPCTVVWIEHYIREGRASLKETWDLVTLDWDGRRFSRPRWKHLTDEEAFRLIGVQS